MSATIIPMTEPQRLRAVRSALRIYAARTHANEDALRRAFFAARDSLAIGRSGATAYSEGCRFLRPQHLREVRP